MEDKKKTVSYDEILSKQFYDTQTTLMKLIGFLKENDDRFKDFNSLSLCSMYVHLSDEDESIFIRALTNLLDCSISNLPTFLEFKDILIKNGLDEDKFSNIIIEKVLEALICDFDFNGIGAVANSILHNNELKT